MVTIRSIGASLLGLATLVAAQTSSYCTEDNLCVKANVPATASSEDFYLQIAAPSDSGWAAVGFGKQMKGALIFLLYPNADGTNITISPRIATGYVMPTYASSIEFEVLPGTGIVDGKWVANILCRNCRKWNSGSLNVKSTSQGFIWAQGTGQKVFSNSREQRITQHAARSAFTMDLVSATGGNGGNPFDDSGNGGSPTNGTDDSGSDNNGGTNNGGNNTNGNSNGGENQGTGGGSGGLPMTKADRMLLAHGMLFAVLSWAVAAVL